MLSFRFVFVASAWLVFSSLGMGCLPDDFDVADAGDAGGDVARDVSDDGRIGDVLSGGDGGGDAGPSDSGLDAPGDDAPGADAPGGDAPESDAMPDVGGDSGPACSEQPLPCLPAGTDRLVEVTSAAEIQDAAAGDILQVRGGRLGRTRVPAFVTLHGCEGAELAGTLTFNGSAGVVEGFVVTGIIVGNQTGEFVVRDNVVMSTDPQGAIQANSNDGLLGHQVVMTVERNTFRGGVVGVAAYTRYSTMVRTVDIDIRNNVFRDVEFPVRLSEGGLTATIDAVVQFNTFVAFTRGVEFFDLDALPTVRGNIFAGGDVGIQSDAPYSAPFNMGWDLMTPTSMRPINGEVAVIPSAFQNEEAGDYRLALGSFAIDAGGPTSPADDHAGCLRPRGEGADVGAFESF